jgi:hypothetical protein
MPQLKTQTPVRRFSREPAWRSANARSRRQARLQLEPLEERNLLAVSVIENFASGNLNAYQTVLRFAPSAQVLPIAAHDDLRGLVKQDGYEWIIRNDAAVQFHAAQTLSAWVKFADVADGRAYFGFDIRPNGLLHSPLGQGGGLALVLAPNTNQLILQKITSTPGSTSAGFDQTNLAAAPQSYVANQWYRAEVSWSATGNTFTGRLYNSSGVGAPLSTVTATTTPQFPQGGIGFRAFGHDKYFDTVVLDSDSTGTLDQRANAGGGLDPSWTAGDPPPPVGNGPSEGVAPVPWRYTSVPGTGRDITLNSFNDLNQVVIIGDRVGLAAANNSLNTGTVQIGWGPPAGGPLAFNSGTPIETPLLAQYLFRQRPGENTRLIGASDVKHFFSSAQPEDTHFLNPTQNDTYVSGLNANQTLYTPGLEIDPVTGSLHDPVDFGHRNQDGITIEDSRTFTDRNQYLLQVRVADLDPAQNPAGTRWYLMGNLFVAGDQDVTNNSRWVEVVPSFDGSHFSFMYPSGVGGRLNFRTIPGLVEPAGPYVNLQTPSGDNFGSVSKIQVRFDHPVNPATFTPASITSFTRTDAGGVTDLSASIIGVSAVSGSGNARYEISFSNQTALGVYQLTLGPNIQDFAGQSMDQDQDGVAGEATSDQYVATFTIQGPRIIASSPSGDNVLPAAQTGSVRLTFNEPINSTTFTRDLAIVRGPNGGIPVTSVTPVAGSNNTQFDVRFAPQTTTGHYTILVLPFLEDMFGHQLDQDGNFIGGELPDDIAVFQFGIVGPKVTSSAPNSTIPGEAFSVRVTFNEGIDVASFTPSQVVSFTGPNGPVNVVSVARVGSGPNYTQFDVVFPAQTAAGTYTLVLSQDIRDVFGNKMDQDGNLIPGENPGDRATVQFTINGPRVVFSNPSGTTSGPVTVVRVGFDTPINASTFTTDQVAASDPQGNPINVTNVAEVPFTNHTQFDITLDEQHTPGRYTLVIGPSIQDVYGNPMDNPATVQFTIAITYAATATTFQNIELLGQPGTFPVQFRNGTFLADDDIGTIDLGANTFNFFGTTYSSLIVSSNALITFGGSNSPLDYANTNLTSGGQTPLFPAIAPLWSDWIKSSGSPMILAKFDGNRLIIEWNQIRHFITGGESPRAITFQAILTLNTGGTAGNIIFNYVDLNTGDGHADGRTSTVGIKDSGPQPVSGGSRLLVSFNSTNPLVGGGKAILIAQVGGAGEGGSGGGGAGGAGSGGSNGGDSGRNGSPGNSSAPWQRPGSNLGASPADSSERVFDLGSAAPFIGAGNRATASIDQFFAFTKDEDHGFALLSLRHHKSTPTDWADPLASDNDGGRNVR